MNVKKMTNKKKIKTGLTIIAFIFPFIFIGPAVFLRGNMNNLQSLDSKNILFLIAGGIIMLIAILGLFIGLKKILDAIFEENPNE